MAYLTIGADPEFFLETTKKKTVVPSQGRVMGTKSTPFPLGSGFASQRDNVAAEYNIPPAISYTDFVNYIIAGKQLLLNSIDYNKRRNLQISKKSSTLMNSKHLDNEEALNFGCQPDFNAWGVCENVIDRDAVDPRFRCVGGHVHVGYILKYPDINPLSLIRYMDLFLGVPSVLLDEDTERRKLYGKAGAYRPTSYGVEYRTLSNFWIHEPRLIRFVWEATFSAVNMARASKMIQPDSELGYNIQEAINTSDKSLAVSVLKLAHLELELGEVISIKPNAIYTLPKINTDYAPFITDTITFTTTTTSTI